MGNWWQALTAVNRAFYGVAAFFSVFFVWQLLATIIGLGGEGGEDAGAAEGADADAADAGGDMDGDAGDAHDAHDDAAEATVSFRLLSLRSIITFFTLFSWGCALYLNRGIPLGRAMAYSILWGLVGMFITAGIFYLMTRLGETGTQNLATCVGERGMVYLNIPRGGTGQVRVSVSGVVSYVKARSADGKAIAANTPVSVSRCLDQNVIEVERIKEG